MLHSTVKSGPFAGGVFGSTLMTLMFAPLVAGCGTSVTTLEIRRASEPLAIDGKVGLTEWAMAQKIRPTQVTRGAGGEDTTIRLLYDDNWLYVAVRCSDSLITDGSDDFWKNDSVRVNFRMGVVEAEDSCQFGFTVTPGGLVSARFHKGRTPPMRADIDFTKPLESRLYRVACTIDESGWTMELALSWSALRPLPIPPEPLSIFIWRRNINGENIEVADWPYDEKVKFQFAGTGR